MTKDRKPGRSIDSNERSEFDRRSVLKAAAATGIGVGGLGGLSGSVAAAPGDQIGSVSLPNHNSGVGITFDGQRVYTMRGLSSTVLQIYEPPAGGNGTATLVSEKDIVDGGGSSVTLSAVEWDPSRGQLWGAYSGNVYLVDVGDPSDGSVDAVATQQFGGAPGTLIDGLAYDGRDDTLWYSPDVRPTVTHYQPDGTVIGTVEPKNASGDIVGVSGVAVGTDLNGRKTLYVGKHGPEQILRVYADDGSFISEFATTGFRIEDLACDPVTYAPNEAILTKDAFAGNYVAFEVEAGTCPIAGAGACPTASTRLLAGQDIDVGSVAVNQSEPGAPLEITYTTTGDWYMTETHLHVAEDCDDIPQTRSGNPKVGRFDHTATHDPAVQEHTVTVPLDATWESGDTLCIAAHAVVQRIVGGEVQQEETAWGEGDRFTQRGNWAMHFDYELC